MIFSFWILPLLSLAYPYCTTRQYGVVPCEVGMSVAECQFREIETVGPGDSFTCQPQVQDTSGQQAVTSICPQAGYCVSTFNQTCVPSQEGVLCSECSGRGRIVLSESQNMYICECYSSRVDPKLFCQPNQFFDPNVVQNVTIDRNYTKVSCLAHQSPLLGCFKNVSSENHKWGDPNPPVPQSCCDDFTGFPPNTIVGTNLGECNAIGGFDPNYQNNPNSSEAITWFECNGHGAFNTTTRKCECYFGWQLTVVGQSDFWGGNVTSCMECSPHMGPSLDSSSGPYCNRIFTPNVITGEEDECSGRGSYINGACSCFQNATLGFWALGTLGGKFDAQGNEVFVQTCLNCQPGYLPPLCQTQS